MQDKSTGSGTESELIRIENAQLYLLDGVESVRMGIGVFSLILMVQGNTPLATLVAQVAEFQWPIGKDAPALKIANLRYTFAMPGLVYGLILPDSTAVELVEKFESYLRQYCTFESRPEIARAAGVSDLRLWSSVGRDVDGESEGARYWTAVADDVEGYNGKLVRQMQNGSKAAADRILKGGEWATWGIKRGGSYLKTNMTRPAARGDGEEMSPRMRKRVDQARRMSAVSKLLSRTVLKGAISATGHVANFLGTAISGAPPVRAFMSNDARRDVLVASVDAFAQVVEAVETAGKSLATATSSVGTDIVQQKFGEDAGQAAQDGMAAMGNMIDTMWTLNKLGLVMLWRATAASTALNNSNRSSRSMSGTSSDSGSKRRMISLSPGCCIPSVNTTRQPSLSMARATSVSTPMAHDDVPQTAQLFPNSPDCVQPQLYVPPNLYVPNPRSVRVTRDGYAAYFYTPQNSTAAVQHYMRSGTLPQVQSFFPGKEVSKHE